MTIIATTADIVLNWQENFPIETNLFPNIIFSPVTAALAANLPVVNPSPMQRLLFEPSPHKSFSPTIRADQSPSWIKK
jgi:hypothetical protein